MKNLVRYRVRPAVVRVLFVPFVAFLVVVGFSPTSAQTTVSRDVLGSGGGATSTSGHLVRGTLSQTAVGRMSGSGTIPRHAAGFWYTALQPEIRATVSLPQIETNTETELTFGLELEIERSQPSSRSFVPRPYRVRIRYNGTLFHLDNSEQISLTYDGTDAVVEFTDTARTENGVIHTFRGITALGNAEKTDLKIESFEWLSIGENRVETTLVNGSLILLDLCREGDDVRLVRSGSAARLSVFPNPASERITLELTPNETGTVRITLIDLLGNDVTELANGEVQADRYYRTEIDLGSIPSGVYMVICRTPTESLTQRLVIRE